jgi:hypothetical protein
MSNTKNSLLSCMTKFVSLEEVAQKNHTSATSEMTTLKTTFTNHASCMVTTTEYLAQTAAWAAQAHFTKDDLLEMLLIRKKADTNARRAEARSRLRGKSPASPPDGSTPRASPSSARFPE